MTRRLGLALLVALATAAPAHADVALDTTYGTGGITGPLLGANPFGTVSASVVQPDGKLLIAGRAFTTSAASTYQRVMIVRLTSAGVLDTDFGAAHDGRTFLPDTFNASNANDAAVTAITVDSQGRIVLAGTGTVAGVTEGDRRAADGGRRARHDVRRHRHGPLRR